MNHLKSSYHDLHRLFESSITVREIAEPLTSFDEGSVSTEVRHYMEHNDFDVVGVQRRGRLTGYVSRGSLKKGLLKEYAQPFQPGQLVADSASLLTALAVLKATPYLFVQFLGNPSGIITRGDLQKAPMRMWLFGLFSLLEMQLLRWIRELHPEDSWKEFLDPHQLDKAELFLEKRKYRNEAIDLADCLSLGDKRTIFSRSPKLLILVAPIAKREWDNLMRDVEALRNTVAHSSDLAADSWPRVAKIVEEVETILRKLEA
jgi:hypothetical protein